MARVKYLAHSELTIFGMRVSKLTKSDPYLEGATDIKKMLGNGGSVGSRKVFFLRCYLCGSSLKDMIMR